MSTQKENKSTKVTEITVLTEEQIIALPDTVKDNVVFLTEKLGSKELITLNPIVVELLTLRELNENLILMPKNSKGDFNEDNIQSYKDLKARTKTFNTIIKSSAKELKSEPAKITKGIIAIEKTFLEENKIIQDAAFKKFEEYEAEVSAKAAIAKAKREKKIQDALDLEKKLKDEANLGLAKSTVYNKVKYEIISKKYIEDVTDAVLNFNEIKLINLRDELQKTTYESLIKNEDISVLDKDVATELKEYWVANSTKATASINSRIESIKKEKENDILQAKNETITETVKNTTEVIGSAMSNNQATSNGGGFQQTTYKPTLPPPPMFQDIESCISNIEYNEFTSEDGRELNKSQAWITLKTLITK